MIKKTTSSLTSILLGVVLFMGTGQFLRAADIVVEDHKLIAMAKEAATPAQHAEVAKQYRLRAEALDNQAAEYEAAAAKAAAKPLPPVAHKWPSMYRQPTEKDKQMAVQTRRAAEEARSLASYHLSRSVETGFGL